jgi:hypothetical protein
MNLVFHVKTASVLAAVAATALASTSAQAVPGRRGASCANPWRVSYVHGRVTGDTRQISLAVSTRGSQTSVAWHAKPGYRFCGLTLVEGLGQIVRSTNPQAVYRFSNRIGNRANGIKSLSVTARNR